MLTTTIRRRSVRMFTATAIAVALPLAAHASSSGASVDVEQRPASTPASSPAPDASAIWVVLQQLPAHDVEVLYAGFTRDVRDDLTAIVEAVAGSSHS